MLLLAAQDVYVVTNKRIVPEPCQPDERVRADVNSLSDGDSRMGERHAKQKTAVQRAVLEGDPIVGVAEIAAELARHQR
jgi:hypothetical protein